VTGDTCSSGMDCCSGMCDQVTNLCFIG
jgi:hypothetical protein